MSRTRHVVTQTWTEVNGSKACIATIAKVGRKGGIQFNDEASAPDTSLSLFPDPNYQIEQTEDKPLFVRAENEGYEIVVDVKS